MSFIKEILLQSTHKQLQDRVVDWGVIYKGLENKHNIRNHLKYLKTLTTNNEKLFLQRP